MLVRLSRKQNRSEHRLMDQLLRHMSRETHVYSGIDQRLHHEKDVCWPSSAQRRRHVYLSFVLNSDCLAERFEHRTNLTLLLFTHSDTRGPRRHTFTNLRRRVRHRSHDRNMHELLSNRLNLGSRHNRNNELLFDERAFQLLQHSEQSLRFHSEHDYRTLVRSLRRNLSNSVAINFEHFHAVFDVHLFTTRLARMRACYLLGTNQLFAEQPGDDCLGHHAATNKCQTAVAKRICISHKTEHSAPSNS